MNKGQRTPLAQICPSNTFKVDLKITGLKQEIDFACFGLDAKEKLSNDAYMTFFNQPETPCGAIELSASADDSASFLCNLDKLPSTIDRLVFTATVDGSETMKQINTGKLSFVVSGKETAQFEFSGTDFKDEKALMVGELYRKDGAWRFCATGAGFNGGLEALVTHFGGDVSDKKAEPKEIEKPKISLSKITLKKSGDKISLEKKGSKGHGQIVCNLNWVQKKGFFGGGGIDLDLACLYELTDGTRLLVQALGDHFGSYDMPPYIKLLGDDRSGESKDGEFIHINGDHLKDIKRICVYAFIYEGVANWKDADAFVTITVPDHPVIEVRLDGDGKNLNLCAVAMLENDNGELKLTKLGKYCNGHQDLDNQYNWGMQWHTARK